MPDDQNDDGATTHADLYQRHEPDQSKWEEKPAVTGRPNDIPLDEDPDLPEVLRNSTLAARAAANKKRSQKVVEDKDAENKAVQAADKKAPAKRAARKSK